MYFISFILDSYIFVNIFTSDAEAPLAILCPVLVVVDVRNVYSIRLVAKVQPAVGSYTRAGKAHGIRE